MAPTFYWEEEEEERHTAIRLLAVKRSEPTAETTAKRRTRERERELH